MAVLTQPATSTQPVQQQVSLLEAGISGDPTADPVYMAFIPQPQYGPPPDPTDDQWNTAYWETDSNPTAYWASCMVGPSLGGVVLTPGAYVICVKVVDPAAIPNLWGWNLVIS